MKSWNHETKWSDVHRTPPKGLGGAGECAVLADTGIDPYSPWFFDPSVKVSYNNVMNHRKIKMAIPYADTVDKSGHGTFVAGVVAGNSYCETGDIGYYNGVAPTAKLVVADLEGDEFLVPGNWSNLMHIAQALNCTVQLNTWTMRNQPLLTFLADLTAYNNPDQLMIFAGESDSRGFVASPADAKNALTVGALYSHASMSSMTGRNGAVFVYPDGLERPITGYCDEMGISMLLSKVNCNDFLKLTIHEEKVGACIMDEEGDDWTPASYKKCSIILVFHDRPLAHRINKPVIRLPSRWRDRFVSELDISIVPVDESGDSQEDIVNLRPESPKTSVYPLRIKPDIVAPGGPVAGPKANSTKCDHSSLTVKSGPSVAAAAIAGEALLLSQYLRKKKITPTANKLRCLLASGAVGPHGDDKGIHNGGYGFGVPVLDKIVQDTPQFVTGTLQAGKTIYYTYRPDETGTLKLTVAFLDYPKDPMSQRQISSHFQVYIKENGGYSDKFAMPNEIPNSEPIYDFYNTIFKLEKHVNTHHMYTIMFVSFEFDYVSEINFTMSFTKGIVDGPYSYQSKDTCPRPCNNGGKCRNGLCECIGNVVGEFCDYEIGHLSFGNHTPVEMLKRGQWQYFNVRVDRWEPGSKLVFDCSRLNMKTTELVFGFGQIPTLNDNSCSFARCSLGNRTKKVLEIEHKDWNTVNSGDPLIIGLFAKSSFTKNASLTVTLM